jgi:hypothetical protein
MTYFGFYMAFGHLSELLFFLLSTSICSCGGVDNALIKGEIANTRLICPIWFGLIMSDCQRVASQVESWTNRGVSYVLCNHVYRLVVCRCGAQRWWSTAKMKYMRVRADRSRAVKGERWDLIEGPKSLGD